MAKSAAQLFADAFRLAPDEAAAFMAQRDALKVSYDWRDVLHDEHARDFTVSRLARMDLLESVREMVSRSVGGDLTRRDFVRDGRALLAKAGWWGEKTVLDPATGEAVTTIFDPARLKLIFDVNTRAAYSAGRWERAQRTKASHPYIRYITKGDERVRASHAAWNNVVLPVDDPFWLTHWPPNGWRCRCRVVAISQRDYDKGYSEYRAPYEYNPDGTLKRIPDVDRVPFKKAPEAKTREWVNHRTGEVLDVPVGVDPGFGYNPGAAGLAQKGKLLLDKALVTDPRTASIAVREALKNERLLDALAEDFSIFSKRWIGEVRRAEAAAAFNERYPVKARGELRHVGALSPDVLDGLYGRGMAPASALVSVRDEDIVHSFRSAKTSPLPEDWYADLPRHLTAPKAVLLDTTKADIPALLMIFDLPGQAGKLVVELDYRVKDRGQKIHANIVRSGRVENVDSLKGFDVLEGAL